MKIELIDYGIGNIKSVYSALTHLDHDVEVVKSETKNVTSDCLLIPGVAAFGQAMTNLKKTGLESHILRHASAGKPTVGLCLGAQLMLTSSDESPNVSGFGFIQGNSELLNSQLSMVPNQGWHTVDFTNLDLEKLNQKKAHMYFSHSYKMKIEAIEGVNQAWARHGQEDVLSVFQKDNYWGVQFHPEKSGNSGIEFLGNLLNAARMQ